MPKKQAKKKATKRGRSTTTRRRKPATKAAPPEDAGSDNACGVYTAEGGETLASLAEQFSIEETLLATINPLIDANGSLAPFDQINIPASDFDLTILEPPVKPAKARSRTRSGTRSLARSAEPASAMLLDEVEPLEPIETGPGWYEVALNEMTEISEQDPAPLQDLRYLRYLMTTNMESTNDESATASAFVHWCLIRAGLLGTGSTAAFSWLDWQGGQLLRDTPQLGAIVVFGPGRDDIRQGPHVAFYAGPDDDAEDTILALGCHLGNRPSILPYPKDRIVGCCWPLA